jgi:hypothetical protein
MLKELVKIANYFDEKRMFEQADIIDSAIEKLSTSLPGGGTRYQSAPGNVVAPTMPEIGYGRPMITDPETGVERPAGKYETKLIERDESVQLLLESLQKRLERVLPRVESLREHGESEDRVLDLAVRFIDESMKEALSGDLPPRIKIALYGRILELADQIYDDVSLLMSQEDLLNMI